MYAMAKQTAGIFFRENVTSQLKENCFFFAKVKDLGPDQVLRRFSPTKF
jgi:hypothetical protein